MSQVNLDSLPPALLAKVRDLPCPGRWEVIAKLLREFRPQILDLMDEAEAKEICDRHDMTLTYRRAVSRCWGLLRELQRIGAVDNFPAEPSVATATEVRNAIDGLVGYALDQSGRATREGE